MARKNTSEGEVDRAVDSQDATDPWRFEDGTAPPAALVARLAPFFPDFDLARLVLRSGTPRFVPRRFRAYTSGCRVFLASGRCDPDSPEDLALLAHEAAHAVQYERHGSWRFRLRYLLEYFRGRLAGLSRDDAYRAISFEQEARQVEERVIRAAELDDRGRSS